MKDVQLILDCQFGSTGKGLIAGHLAKKNRPDTVVTAWAPNAGHTYIDSNGRKFVHTMLANGVVSPNLKRVMIGPGSIINIDALSREIDSCADYMRNVRLIIHPHAAVVTQRHIDEEAGPMVKIGSTKKGVGAAAIQRIRRDPDDSNVARDALVGSRFESALVSVVDWHSILHEECESVQVEGAQGYSLSMYHGFYPYTTSRDVSTWQTLADCAIPARFCDDYFLNVIGTARTFPIRVANRFEDGKQVGWSGPHYPDQVETTWGEIGQPVEHTTVTRLPRRVFTYSRMQMEQAIRFNGVDEVFLNFANYLQNKPDELQAIIDHLDSLSFVTYLGWGPSDADIEEVEEGWSHHV